MYIRKLVIRNQKEEKNIREINFKLGANLIVDISKIENQQETGNDVGKTTVLRLINYCLGGKAEEIYKNKESTNSKNTVVHDFLVDNEIIIILTLCTDFNDTKTDIIVKRNFLKTKKKICSIDGFEYSNVENFKKELKQILFKSCSNKPTYRQLISRYLRFNYSSEQIIKYLPFGASDQDYEQIYLFLYGLDQESEMSVAKGNELNSFSEYEKIRKKLFNNKTQSILEQEIAVLDEDIVNLEEQKNIFNINQQYEKEVLELYNINDEINSLMEEYSDIKTRLKIYECNICDIQNEKCDINTKDVEALYNEAGIYLPQINKTLEETIKFHNKLIMNKINFIKTDIPILKNKIKDLNEQIKLKKNAKKELEIKQKKYGSLAEYESIISNLKPLYEKKGKLLLEQEKIIEYDNLISECSTKIIDINSKIQDSDKKLQENLRIFNKYFCKYAKELYNESYLLSTGISNTTKCYKFELSNLNSNIGAGKQKGLMSAYDLAYISFANELQLQRPKFILHDRIEDIHNNQLVSLMNLVNSNKFDGQYIVSVLSGKFKDEQLQEILNKNKIIELSPDKKLFNIEQYEGQNTTDTK